MFGHIPGVKVGQIFESRRALHDANVHRGLMRGIAPEAASIVLSGGYVDDIDDGDVIIYTGEGGRDQDTKKQITDQTLTGGNKSLVKNYIEGNPIRVNRGHALESKYAPQTGYRYDGLYRVDQYWEKKGRDGFIIWQYRLIRLESQPALGVLEKSTEVSDQFSIPVGNTSPARSMVTISRVIRNTEVGNQVKKWYEYKCQVCGITLQTPTEPYAECCHIRPLGKPHNGPDTTDNVLCLCPNCHLLFDTYALTISDNLMVIETGRKLNIDHRHHINKDSLTYHRRLILKD